VLAAAGCADADLLVALTSSDEVNMVACQVAWSLFKTPTKIARIRAASYAAHPQLFGELTGFAVDRWLSPEQLVTEYVERLIEHPGALQVVDFADGRVRLVGVRAVEGGLLVGQPLSNLPKHIPGVETRVAALYRRGRSIRPDGETVIEPQDEVFFLAAREDIRTVMSELRKLEARVRRIVIAGAGHIGVRLAQALEGRVQVKLIERDKARARRAAETLREAIVLNGDAADEDLLIEENVDSADVFISVTNAEEANILSAMVAKRLGCRKVMALINRPAYAELMESDRIDIAISPQTVTIGSLLAHVRRGDVAQVHSLRRGAAEAIEAIAHGDSETSQVVGRPVEAVGLPEGTTIGAIVRGDDVIMAHHDTVIEEGDHVIMFLTDRRHVEAVEKLFQVGVSFL
jgi:trk system potassium uptake protein TrkA